MVRADSGVLKGRALHLPSRVVPSQTVHNIGICTCSLYSHVLGANYALDCCRIAWYHGARERQGVRMEAKSKQMPLQTSRQATKAMAQQVPMSSSDILFHSHGSSEESSGASVPKMPRLPVRVCHVMRHVTYSTDLRSASIPQNDKTTKYPHTARRHFSVAVCNEVSLPLQYTK